MAKPVRITAWWWTVLLLLGCIARPAAAGTAHAIVVGNNRGLATERRLSFAHTDARKVAQVLIDAQVVPARQVKTLVDRDFRTVVGSFWSLVRSVGPQDILLAFLSAHGSQAGLHVDGVIWPWGSLRQAVLASRARLVIVFVDACQSGSLLSPKGLGRSARVAVKATLLAPRGRIVIASSSASELSHESALLQGSPFAHSLASGLRGAADGNGDGSITVSELYAYIYQRALALTLNAPSGPQHAMQEWRLSGAGEVVLSRGSGSRTRVTLGAGRFERCFVLDAEERHVLGEVRAGGEPVVFAPERYVVKCPAIDRLYVGQMRLARADVQLDRLRFEQKPYPLQLAKGETPVAHTELSWASGVLARHGRSLWPAAALRGHIGPRSGGLDLRLGAGFGRWSPQEPMGVLLFSTLGLDVTVPWWQALGSGLETGIEVGFEDHVAAGAHRVAGLIGPYARLGWPVADGWRLLGRLDLLTQLPFAEARDPGFATLTTLSVAYRLTPVP